MVIPENNNARHSYQQVLALEPQNPTALAGLQRIADHFFQKAERLLAGFRHTPREDVLELCPDPPRAGIRKLASGLAQLGRGPTRGRQDIGQTAVEGCVIKTVTW